MSMLNQFLSVAGQILLVAVLLTLLAGRFVQDMHRRKMLVATMLVLCMLVPLNGLTLAQWLRSVVGDMSVLTLFMLLNILAKRLSLFNIINELSFKTLLFGVLLTGVLFYPLALGLGTFDPYRLGYEPAGLSVALLLLSVTAWFGRMRDLAVLLPLPLLAFNLHLLESSNLWDYLLDPVIFVYAFVQSALDLKANWLQKASRVS